MSTLAVRHRPLLRRLCWAGVGVVLALSMAGPFLPLSGHMLFYAYSVLTTRGGGYRLLALTLAAVGTYFKLALWDDASSWGPGIAGRVALAGAHRWMRRKRSGPE